MNTKNVFVVIILAILLGCNSTDIRESVKPAEHFKLLLYEELNDDVNADDISGGAGWSDGNDVLFHSTYSIPIVDSNYDHSNTYKKCLKVLSKWKEHFGYGADVVKAGGGDNHFSMQYKVNSVYVFIDVISYSLRDHNVVQILIRAH